MDDCSSDNSLEILKEYASHNKVSHFVVNKENSGSTFKQWKRGIELTQGEYIWIAESDDYCEITFLETLFNALNNNPEVTFGYVQSVTINQYNQIKWISRTADLEKIINGKEFIKSFLLSGNAVHNASMALFRKDAYLQLSPEFTDYKFCGDWLFWACPCKTGRCIYKR